MSVCVVTDSSAVMPPAWISDLPLRIVPLEIAWSDGTLDTGDLPYAAIAERLRTESTPPKTGAPAPGMYAELLARLLTDHDGVLVVTPAAELSTTYSSALLGARELGSRGGDDGRVRVLDCGSAAAGQGIVAAEAARSAVDGSVLDDVFDRAVSVGACMNIWATLSQLDFLRRSGRVPAIAAAGAGALGLQPIIRYAGSSPAPVGIARSTGRALDRLFRAWERSIVLETPLRAVAFHSARDEDAAELVERINSSAAVGSAEAVEVTASLAAHTGPGLLGLAWFWDIHHAP